MKENEERPLSNEVKRHFLEIVSTYNKYQESMDRKSDITQVAETLGGITEAARTLAIKEACHGVTELKYHVSCLETGEG